MRYIKFLVLILLFGWLTEDAAAGTDPSLANGPGARVSFDQGWIFSRFGPMPDGSNKAEPPGLQTIGVDEKGWRSIQIPHDWAIEGPFSKSLPSNTGKLPWQGIGWYRKHFIVNAADSGKCFFVEFDGAMSHAKIWLNGQYVGEWPYGYASFQLELTPYIRFNDINVIAVRLENPPGFSRWYPGGGIYRNVWLRSSAKTHIGHWGVFVTTPHVSSSSATVHVQTTIENQSSETAAIILKSTIGELGGNATIISLPDGVLQIPAGQKQLHEGEVTFPPKLWDISSPNLYVLRSSILLNGHIVDTSSTVFGIRSAVFDAEKGFLLNGHRITINGTCNHHDSGPLGTAINKKALARQIRILKEMGGNAIRTSHNPPAPELLDLCDRMGMLILDEAFDCWETGKVQNDYSSLFKEWHERDIRALVLRDRNHPSVIFWSSGNEIREQQNGDLAGKLRDIFHAADPTRPVTAACDNPQAGFDGFQKSVDVFGFNYKPHLYEKFHKENPTIPFYGSETASCISSNGEYIFPVSDDKLKGFADGQVSSYDLYAPPWATTPDAEFASQDKNPAVAGEFVWTGFDYIGEPTPFYEDSSSSRSSYFGIVDLCGFPKDRFYLYQARWRSDLPMAHILPTWNWPGREGQVTPVHVYTSGDEAELFLNGRSLGRKKKGPYEYRLRWDDTKYEPGELMVIAYRDGREWARDVQKTTEAPARLILVPEDSTVKADGNDLEYLKVKVVDRNGLMVPTATNVIRFHVSGPGDLVAVCNGDPTNMESFQADHYPAFHGQCLVIVRTKTGVRGTITVTANAESLEGAKALVVSR